MLPYFIFLFIVIIVSSLLQRFRHTPYLSSLFKFILFLVLVLFASLRNASVGTDTNNYVGSFLSDRNRGYNIFEIQSSIETGYLFLERFAQLLTDQYWVLLLLVAMITVYFYLKTILKLSKNYGISFLVFITLGSYLFFFNGARQGIAAAIFSFSIIEIKKRNLKKYLLWIALAFLFHKTVIITTPLYYILRLKYSTKNLIIIIASSLLLINFSFDLLLIFPESFIDRFNVYENRGSRGGLLLTIFYVSITFIFIFLHKFISLRSRKDYDVYLNMTIFSSIIYSGVYLAGLDINLVRLSLYFSLGFVLIWPIIFKDIQHKLLPLLFVFFIFGHLIFYYVYLDKMADLIPYKLNKVLFLLWE